MATVKKIWRTIRKRLGVEVTTKDKIKKYLAGGREPWSPGYNDFKFHFIREQLSDAKLLAGFNEKRLEPGYGFRLDERSVEYPWVFSRITTSHKNILDAGSTFNNATILDSLSLENCRLTIYTYFPEKNCFHSKRINYVFGDLRDLPFKNSLYDLVICQSTIEHVGMDNQIYGYKEGKSGASAEYLKVVDELVRVLAHGGKLLITFPYGKHKNYGFFQQFDKRMLDEMADRLKNSGNFRCDFFKYERDGWRFAEQHELTDVLAYNPHTGEDKLDDGAAHCRGIACIEFDKR